MKQVLVATAGFALIGAIFAGASFASGPVTAQAPNARLALLVDGGDLVGNFAVLRKKGVASVTNPLTGVYCIKPSSTTMALGKIVPMVAPEVNGSFNADTTAAWNSLLVYCPKGTIEVDTFQVSTRVHRNNVGFTVTVF